MSGRSSAGRSRGRGSGGRNSIGRGGSNSVIRSGNSSVIRSGGNVSGDDRSNDEHMDQFDGLENLNGMNSPEIGSPSSEAQHLVERVTQKMEEMREAHEKAKSEMEEREAKIPEAHENAKKEMAEREERLKKEVEDSKALTEAVRNEMREQMAKIMKHIPNFES